MRLLDFFRDLASRFANDDEVQFVRFDRALVLSELFASHPVREDANLCDSVDDIANPFNPTSILHAVQNEVAKDQPERASLDYSSAAGR